MSVDTNLHTICRVCMRNNIKGKSIFNSEYFYNGLFEIKEVITTCASVQILIGDGLPEQICPKCLKDLRIAYNFKNTCESSDYKLRSDIKQNEIKIELNEISIKEEEEPEYSNFKQSNENVEAEVADVEMQTENSIHLGSSEIHDNIAVGEGTGAASLRSQSETTFKCQQCRKYFKNKLSLSIHLWKHKAKACKICGKIFTSNSNLLKHKRMKHSKSNKQIKESTELTKQKLIRTELNDISLTNIELTDPDINETTSLAANENKQHLKLPTFLEDVNIELANFESNFNPANAEKLDHILENQNKIMMQLSTLQTSIDFIAKMFTNLPTAIINTESTSSNSATSLNAFPEQITSDEDLKVFEDNLKCEDYFNKVVDSMKHICGNTGKANGIDCCYRLIDHFIKREVLTKCSWTGSSKNVQGEKLPFKFFENFRRCFLQIIICADKDFTMSECDMFFKTILKNSVQRSKSKCSSLSRHKRRPKNLMYKKKIPSITEKQGEENIKFTL